jgi:hypothetical protein
MSDAQRYGLDHMRISLVIAGLVLCLIGSQFFLVDKIVLHEGVLAPEDPEGQFYEVDDTSQRHIDLPDSGGFALTALGAICLLFSLGLKRHRDKG